MNWLRPAVLAVFAPALFVPACSSDDSSQGVFNYDASQTPIPKREAGASCVSDTDCLSGLVCLYPASTCDAYRECTTPPADPCPTAQTACSCLGETIQVCNGFSSEPFQSMGDCPDGGAVVAPDAGPVAPEAGSGTPDASDASLPNDAGPGPSDGAGG